LALQKSPRLPGEAAWWEEDYVDPLKIKDRGVFA
jgi:hypothetical protein